MDLLKHLGRATDWFGGAAHVKMSDVPDLSVSRQVHAGLVPTRRVEREGLCGRTSSMPPGTSLRISRDLAGLNPTDRRLVGL